MLQKSIPLAPLDLGGRVTGAVARLDLLHSVVSGNKLFKLWYYLDRCLRDERQGIVTFGGAYSNHLVATAFACMEMGIPCTGVVRGEEPGRWSQTLEDCRAFGMRLEFVPRREYRALSREAEVRAAEADGAASRGADSADGVASRSADSADGAASRGAPPRGPLIIPEGGAGEAGVRGAGLILDVLPGLPGFTHLLMPVGTGTTLRGIQRVLRPGQTAVGIPVMAVPPDEQAAFDGTMESATLVHGFAFGGYGKHTPELLDFMRSFHREQGAPTDFVYTGKAAFALMTLVRNGYFPDGSQILFLHTGGLQGNRSLPHGVLGF